MTQENAVTFTCDISTTIEHIILTVLTKLEHELNSDDYLIQVSGVNEYLEHDAQLQDYEYVHQCYKVFKFPLFWDKYRYNGYLKIPIIYRSVNYHSVNPKCVLRTGPPQQSE